MAKRDKVKRKTEVDLLVPLGWRLPPYTLALTGRWLLERECSRVNLPLLQIPPAPTKPDFDGPREKMQKLGEGEGSMTKEEFAKMKQELEA